MTRPKYAQKVDLNQSEIVKALRAIGCDVELIGRPVDALVGYRKHNFLLEIKQEGKQSRKDQKAQQDWIKNWRGQVRYVTSPEEAIRLVTMGYRTKEDKNHG
jgi:hypothetical protein